MITVVSGLPRSGTSLMMQMLAAGGMPVLVDDARPADDHNRRGYFEDHRVKSLETDNTWLADAEGKAIKIVSLLLYQLPPEHAAHVIIMRRDLDEVLRSQEVMLTGSPAAAASSEIRAHFEKHLQALNDWLAKQPHISVLEIQHRDAIENPREVAKSVAAFLEKNLDIDAMTSVVDPTLYRQRRL